MTGTAEDTRSLEAAVDAAIQACGGEARAAVRSLIVANNYLEAEVKRLAEAVSSGFTRRFKAKEKESRAIPHPNERGPIWRPDIDGRFPHSVDLVPPEDGLPEAVEQQIAHFLEVLGGAYELIVDLRGDDLIERYYFAQEQDAAAFRNAFANAARRCDAKITG
jgi:hypothetical protein